MATEVLSPDAILAQTALSGVVSSIQDDPDSPDGNWITADASTNTAIRVSFPTPNTTPTDGAGLQEFRVLLRYNNTPGSTITYTAELYDSGTSVQVLATTATLSSNGVVSLTWNSVNLTNNDGSGVELLISQDGGHTGNPGNRRYLEIGAVEWVANVAEAAQTLTAPLVDDSTDTFYSHTLQATYTLLPPLFDDGADTFYTHQLIFDQILTPPLFDDSTDTFYTTTIYPTYTIQSSYIDDSVDIFYSPTVVPGPINITATLLDDSTDTFYAGTVSLTETTRRMIIT